MSHTPGPWELAMSADGCFILFGAKGRNLLTIPLDEQNEEKTANARLIAAAPELLECLKHIQGIVSESQGVAGWHQNGQVASWDELGICEEINAVLAKVRGEME